MEFVQFVHFLGAADGLPDFQRQQLADDPFSDEEGEEESEERGGKAAAADVAKHPDQRLEVILEKGVEPVDHAERSTKS